MFLIICGGDCTGKTTICKNLEVTLPNAIYHHFDKPAGKFEAMKEYNDYINNINIDNNYIIDRIYDGEFVYAKLYRSYTQDILYLRDIEEKLMNIHGLMPMVIYVTADLKDILNRAETRGEDFVKPEDHSKVKELYENFMNMQCLPFIRINTSELNQEETMKKVFSGIAKYETLCARFYNGNWNWGNLLDYKYAFIDVNKTMGIRHAIRPWCNIPAEIKKESIFINLAAAYYTYDKAEYIIVEKSQDKNLIPVKDKVITIHDFLELKGAKF